MVDSLLDDVEVVPVVPLPDHCLPRLHLVLKHRIDHLQHSKVNFVDQKSNSYSQSIWRLHDTDAEQEVVLIKRCELHLNELVLVEGAEEQLGLDALLQPRPLFVRLGVHHLHVLTLVVLRVVSLANFNLEPMQNQIQNSSRDIVQCSKFQHVRYCVPLSLQTNEHE